MIKVTHLITSLDSGGAEWMLAKLLSALPHDRFDCSVISLMKDGPVGNALRAQGIAVTSLNMRRGSLDIRAVARLVRILDTDRPDILQTWLYHSDLAGLLVSRLAGRPCLVWNVRCSYLDMHDYSLSSALVRRVLAWSSRLPDHVLFNSQAGLDIHRALGYRPRGCSVIPNGFDLEMFEPDLLAGARLRAELGLPSDALVIGKVARFDPMKDHRTFLRAAAILSQDCPNAHFVLLGAGTGSSNSTLAEQIRLNGLDGRVHGLGMRLTPSAIIPGFDFLVSASAYGEGFPNVIGEAMACGIPCVATNSGDCRSIIADTGTVVPTRNPAALAEAMIAMAQAGTEARRVLGQAARQRMEEHYSLPQIASRYAELYTDLARQSK